MSRKPACDKKGKQSADYQSVCIGTMLDDRMSPVSLGNLEKLDLELLLLYQEIAPTQVEISSRRHVFNKVRKVIAVEFPAAEVVPFGSHSTELIVPSSDIDIGVQFPEGGSGREFANRCLGQIRNALSRASFAARESLFHIRKSRTPILKFRDRAFGFKIDISINQKNGVDAAHFIKHILRERPYMKVFAILLKYFLTVRSQADAATGGLNSYSQFLLLLSFFQLHPLVQTNMVSPLKNIGVLFLDFFQFYGCDFPYKSARISVNSVGYVGNDTRMLSIEDPIDPAWDVAAVCRNSTLVLEIFQHAFRAMTAAFREETPVQKSLLSLWFKKRPEESRWREQVRRMYFREVEEQRRL